MQPKEVQQLIEQGLPGCKAMVDGDGSHFQATVVSAVFENTSMVQQQQMVYRTLGDKITNGEVHALTIKTYTPSQWETAQKLGIRN